MENRISFEQRKLVYDRAIAAFGADMQLVVAVEELSELQKEICKALRGGLNVAHMAEEIADVLIMAEQLQQVFQLGELVKHYQDKKIIRLAQRIDMSIPVEVNK